MQPRRSASSNPKSGLRNASALRHQPPLQSRSNQTGLHKHHLNTKTMHFEPQRIADAFQCMLAAPYQLHSRVTNLPAMDDTLTMRPERCSRIRGASIASDQSTQKRFTSNIWRADSGHGFHRSDIAESRIIDKRIKRSNTAGNGISNWRREASEAISSGNLSTTLAQWFHFLKSTSGSRHAPATIQRWWALARPMPLEAQ